MTRAVQPYDEQFMDFQPQNQHVRDAESLGHEHAWPADARVWAYLCSAYGPHAELIEAVRDRQQPAWFGPRKWVTFWGGYSHTEACSALALPSFAPDTRVEFTLRAGVFVRGPAWVEPFPFDQVLADHDIPRRGNGLELLVLDPLDLSACGAEVAPITSPSSPWSLP